MNSERRTRPGESRAGRPEYRILRAAMGAFLLGFCLLASPTATRADDDKKTGANAGAEKSGTKSEEAEDAKPPSEAEVRREKILDRVNVVGSTGHMDKIPGSVNRIDSEMLDHQNQAFDDIHRILFRIPGLNIQEEEGYGLRPNIGMRGTGSERSSNITLMEDGILIAPAPYAAPSAYYFPVSGRMESIEVRKGSSQVKYGPRTNGGALNLVSTSVPDRLRIKARAAGGGDDTRKLYAGYGDSFGIVSWMLETYRIRTDGFKRLDTGGSTGFDVEDYQGKIRLSTRPEASTYQELTFKVGFYDEVSHETYLGLTDGDFAHDPFRRYAGSRNDEMQARQRQLQLRHFIEISDRVDLTSTVYRNDFERNWYKLDKVDGTSIADILEDPAGYTQAFSYIKGEATSADDALSIKANNREYFSRGIESILGAEIRTGGISQQVEMGVRYHEDEEDRFQHSDGYRMEAGGAMVLTTAGVPGASGGGDNRVNSAGALAVFVQDELRTGRWTVTPGLRFEHIETERAQYPSGDPGRNVDPNLTRNTTDVLVPGVGVNLLVTPSFSAFAGVHRGFAPPGPGAPEETRAEESVNYEIGTRASGGRVRAGILGFYSDYSNLIGKDTFASGGTGSGDLFNAGAVDIRGLEAELTADLIGHRAGRLSIPLELAYTYTESEFRSSFVSSYGPWGTVESGDELPYVPKHQLSASLAVAHPRARLELFGTYASAMRTEAGQGELVPELSTDERTLLDVTAEARLHGGARAFVTVQNITDETYIVARRPAGVRPGLPRRVMAGLKIDI